jgi:hypothetical protein
LSPLTECPSLSGMLSGEPSSLDMSLERRIGSSASWLIDVQVIALMPYFEDIIKSESLKVEDKFVNYGHLVAFCLRLKTIF